MWIDLLLRMLSRKHYPGKDRVNIISRFKIVSLDWNITLTRQHVTVSIHCLMSWYVYISLCIQTDRHLWTLSLICTLSICQGWVKNNCRHDIDFYLFQTFPDLLRVIPVRRAGTFINICVWAFFMTEGRVGPRLFKIMKHSYYV